MRIIASILTSLDGYLAGPNNEIDWFVYDEEFGKYVRDLMNNVDGIIYGKTSYEWNSQYWPTATNNDPMVVEKMNTVPKYVFSTTLTKVGWGKFDNAHLIKTNVEGEVKKLKEKPGKDIVIFGSSKVVSSFLEMGLLDELRIFVQPIVLGTGKQLFTGVKERHKLKLSNSKALKSGVVQLVYTPAS